MQTYNPILNVQWEELHGNGNMYDDECIYMKPIENEKGITGFMFVSSKWLDTVWNEETYEYYNTDTKQEVFLFETGEINISQFLKETSDAVLTDMIEEMGYEDLTTIEELKTQAGAYDLAYLIYQTGVREFDIVENSFEVLENDLFDELYDEGVTQAYEGYVSRISKSQTHLANERLKWIENNQ